MDDTRIGFSVRIFVATGEPDGLRIVEKSNWTGQGLVFPRSLFGEIRERPEFDRTGVYILWGESEGGLPRVYVGEGDTVVGRLDEHVKKKDFWTHGVVFTSKDQSLNKAHIQHLEARLIGRAHAAKRSELENGNVPQLPSLTEADVADAEGFLRDLLLCLPVVGVPFFEIVRLPSRHVTELVLKGRGIEAHGYEDTQGFVVRMGSLAARTETESMHGFLRTLRKAMVENGLLEVSGDHYRLAQDYVFQSPSTASGVMLGRNSNGRVEWKDLGGRTLKEIQEASVAVG